MTYVFLFDIGQTVKGSARDGPVPWMDPGPVYNLRALLPDAVVDTDEIPLAWDISSGALEYHVYRSKREVDLSTGLEMIGSWEKIATVPETRNYISMTPDDIKFNPVLWTDKNAFQGKYAYYVCSWTEYAGGTEGKASNIVKVENQRKKPAPSAPSIWWILAIAFIILIIILIALWRSGRIG